MLLRSIVALVIFNSVVPLSNVFADEPDSLPVKRDSLHRRPFERTVVGSEPAYSPRQDTTYLRGKRVHVAPASRFRHDIAVNDSAVMEEQRKRSNTIEGLIAHNMVITPLDMIP